MEIGILDSTKNYGLNKPSENDYFNVVDWNDNFDVIDGELKKQSDGLVENSERVGVLENTGDKQNLFINGNFDTGVLINQRGETSYSAGRYTIDMWKLTSGEENGAEIDLTGSYVVYNKLVDQSIRSLFQQILETPVKANFVTVSVKLIGEAGKKVRIQRRVGGLWTNTLHTLTGSEEVITSTVSAVDGFDCVHIEPVEAQSLTLIYAKAEVGEVATEFVARSRGVEEQDCQRYLQKIGPFRNFTPYSVRANDIGFDLQLEREMRTAPTIIYEEVYIWDDDTFANIDGFTITYLINKRGGKINANKTAHGLNIGRVFFQMKNNNTSGLLLSAEM